MSEIEMFSKRLNRFFFPEKSNIEFEIIYRLFFLLLFVFFFEKDFSAWLEYSDMFWTPPFILSYFFKNPPSKNTVEIAQIIWKFSILYLSIGGHARRVVAVFSALLSLFLFSLDRGYNEDFRTGPLVITSLVFAWSGASTLSLTQVLFRNRKEFRETGVQYGVPLRVLQMLWVSIFFSAGLSKVINAGFDWPINSFPYYFYLSRLVMNLEAAGSPMPPTLSVLSSIGFITMVLELLTPLVLISRRARRYIILAVFSFQLSVYFSMGISFHPFLCLYLVWVPWEKVIECKYLLPIKKADG